jgi:PAS domain S-box-containing protein
VPIKTDGQLAEDGRLREFLGNIELSALMLDLAGRIVFVNEHLTTLLGRSQEELVGQDWIDIAVPEPERPAVRAALRDAIAGLPTGGREDGIVTRTGEERRLAWQNVIQRDSAGAVSRASPRM